MAGTVHQSLLGLGGQACLPWLPDETVFSLCSRHHRVSVQRRAASTSEALFGHARAGRAHDFPDRIDAFVERTGGALGTVEDVIRRHTVLPFYLPFRSASLAHESFDALRGAGIGSLKFRLGLLTSRFRAHHPLKACPRCMQQDRDRAFVAYWHVTHQLPGVWLCTVHGTLLLESTLKATGVERFLWHLPDETTLRRHANEIAAPHGTDQLIELLASFAHASIGLASLPEGFHFESVRLALTNRRQLSERRLLRSSGRIHPHAAASMLSAFLAPLRCVPELAPLALTEEQATSVLRNLCSASATSTHPLRHIALALWLFGSWNAFMDGYRAHDADKPLRGFAVADARNSKGQSDPRLEPFLRMLRDDGLSVTKAASLAGIDTQTGLVWAAQAGMRSPRRPKKLMPAVRSTLIEDLLAGMDKKDVARRYGIAVQTVTTTLRTEVGLRDAWASAKFARQRCDARQLWTDAADQNGRAGAKALRWMVPAAYAWLYRHDRTWLQEQIARLPGKHRSNHASVDWDDRDTRLASAVEQACVELAAELPGQRLRLWHLYQRVPDLKTKLRKLDRLPLTSAVISRALSFKPSADTPLL